MAIANAKEIDEPALVASRGSSGSPRCSSARTISRDAEPELRRCLEDRLRAGQSPRWKTEATSWLGHRHVLPRTARKRGSSSAYRRGTWFERTGDTYFQVQNIIRALALFALRRRPGRGGGSLAAGGRCREGTADRGWVVLETYWHLVEALVAQDRLDDAREIVAFAARSVPEEDAAHARSLLLMAEATVATAAGEERRPRPRLQRPCASTRSWTCRWGGPDSTRPIAAGVWRDERREDRARAGAVDVRPDRSHDRGRVDRPRARRTRRSSALEARHREGRPNPTLSMHRVLGLASRSKSFLAVRRHREAAAPLLRDAESHPPGG